MAFLSNLFKSTELKAFERALKNREYSRAVELGRSGEIPERLVQEARCRLALTEAIQAYSQDAEKTAYLDDVLNLAMSPDIFDRIKSQPLRDKILVGHCSLTILARDFDSAITRAESIQDKDWRTIMLRKVAGFATSDPTNLDKAVKAILSIESPSQQFDALNKLSLSRLILGDFDAAIEIMNRIPLKEQQAMTKLLVDFVIQHKGESMLQIQSAATHADPGVTRHRMALIHAANKDVAGMAESLRGTVAPQKANILTVYAHVLAWSGQHDAALTLLREIDPRKRVWSLGYILSCVPFSQALAESIFLEMEANDPEVAAIYHFLTMSEMAFSNRMQDVARLLRKMKSLKMRDAIIIALADDTYELQKVFQPPTPVGAA